MRIEQIRQSLRDHGAKPCHEQRVLRAWVHARSLDEGTRRQRSEDFLPLGVRGVLPAVASELERMAQVYSEHPGQDGSARLLVRLADGQTVESVLLPRDGVCVSTQVGCAVGCAFCMTGREGLRRQLGSAEIVAQVVLARHRRKVGKVVFMGMGEPAHNMGNVLEAIDLLGTEGAIGHKNLVFSTVGDRRVFDRLMQGRVKPALAISLHTTNSELRARLLPRAPHVPPEELIEHGERYARTTGYPIQYQWTLLEGVNDNEADVDRAAELLAGKYAMMNFIPFNTVDGLGFKRPAWQRAVDLARRLRERGIVASLRDSAGQDIDGGCGQLRARTLAIPLEKVAPAQFRAANAENARPEGRQGGANG